MTSVETNFQNMKESAPFATTPIEPGKGLVEAFLELDDGASSGSEEEFLDFQFRIADANANLQERESSEHMSDWRASFASLQLKQAHEVAEFALARRREDELQIDRQAKEIIELRRSLEASRMETEQVKANCALLTEEKLKLEEALANQHQICRTFRANVSELSKAQDHVSSENTELKRSLDEAVVTTGRLKFALEEKAAELVAWLGLDGVAPHGLVTQCSEDELSPRTEEKLAYSVSGDSYLRSEESRELENLLLEEEFFERTVAEKSNELSVLPPAAEKVIPAVVEECEDMNRDVLIDIPKCSTSRDNLQDASDKTQIETSGIELQGDGSREHFNNSKDKEAIVILRQKIKQMHWELETLQAEESQSEQQQEENNEHSEIRKSLAQMLTFRENDDQHSIDFRLSDASSSSKDSEARDETDLGSPEINSEETGNALGRAGDQISGEGDSGISGEGDSDTDAAVLATNDPGPSQIDLQMTESQFSESFASLEHGESSARGSITSLEDKFMCVNRSQSWPMESVSQLVESITEELTKLLRVIEKTPPASSEITFKDLETRVKAWSNVTSNTLKTRLSSEGAVQDWKGLVVDFLGQSRQELMSVQQRLCDCESELALMDKFQAESLTASYTVTALEDEINRLEAQSFSDQIEKEEVVNLLKEELEQARKETAERQNTIYSLREQLEKSEIELEKLGWVAEQEFINSCFGGEQDQDDRMVRREEVGRMEKKMEDLMARLEENERELGELLIISGVDSDAVVSAKIRRLEQRLEDAKASEESLIVENAALASLVDALKARLAEVEYELQIESQQHVDVLVRYEEEQGLLEASTRSETGNVQAKLTQMEQLLAEKTKQLELLQGGQDLSPSQTQLLALRARVLTLESNLAVTRQKAVDCESTIKSQMSKEKEKYASLEAKFIALQSEVSTLKTQLTETEQRERRAQINVDKLMVELGIAKEEVLRYEVRLQKTERQAKEDLEIEKRKHEETIASQKQMEWHLCRQLELTEGLDKEKAKLREVLEEFELQNLALQRESDNLRTAYMQLARQAEQRSR